MANVVKRVGMLHYTYTFHLFKVLPLNRVAKTGRLMFYASFNIKVCVLLTLSVCVFHVNIINCMFQRIHCFII
jgi:hypothetical protein